MQNRFLPRSSSLTHSRIVLAGAGFDAAHSDHGYGSRDLRVQREELALQRAALQNAEKALRRSADMDARRLHTGLMAMAIGDPVLAEVLPSHGGPDARTRKQHLYVNLLLQHVWGQYTAGIASEEEMISNIRHLFASPRIREYWRSTAMIRKNVYVEGTQEHRLATATDLIWQEYESLLACSPESPHRPGYGEDTVPPVSFLEDLSVPPPASPG